MPKESRRVNASLSLVLVQGDSWPELFAFLQQHLSSADAGARTLGMYLASVLCEALGDQGARHLLRTFGRSFHQALRGDQPEEMGFYAVRALTSLVRDVFFFFFCLIPDPTNTIC